MDGDLIRRLNLSIEGFARHEPTSTWVWCELAKECVAELTQLREQQWNCPACGFTCERIHVEDQPDEEKCPACNEQRLREQVAAKDAEITRLEDVISLLKLSGAGWRSV